MILLELYWEFVKIGLFSIGGGYASLPLIQESIVGVKQWLSAAQFTDLLTISQITPGPIAINSATFVGMHVSGIAGSVICTLGYITPSLIFSLILAFFYYKFRSLGGVQAAFAGLRPAVVGLIMSAALSIALPILFETGENTFTSFIKPAEIIMFCAVLIILRSFKKLNSALVILACGLAGGAYFYFVK